MKALSSSRPARLRARSLPSAVALGGGAGSASALFLWAWEPLADQLSHRRDLGSNDRRIMFMAGISAAFAPAFGAPLTGVFEGPLSARVKSALWRSTRWYHHRYMRHAFAGSDMPAGPTADPADDAYPRASCGRISLATPEF
ncbi:MAG: hypothetical protein ABW154_13765 [Dyella sp.]